MYTWALWGIVCRRGRFLVSGSSSRSSVTATLRWEIVIVLAVTFGMSGLRATLRLVEALVSPTPLKGQTTQLN